MVAAERKKKRAKPAGSCWLLPCGKPRAPPGGHSQANTVGTERPEPSRLSTWLATGAGPWQWGAWGAWSWPWSPVVLCGLVPSITVVASSQRQPCRKGTPRGKLRAVSQLPAWAAHWLARAVIRRGFIRPL